MKIHSEMLRIAYFTTVIETPVDQQYKLDSVQLIYIKEIENKWKRKNEINLYRDFYCSEKNENCEIVFE